MSLLLILILVYVVVEEAGTPLLHNVIIIGMVYYICNDVFGMTIFPL